MPDLDGGIEIDQPPQRGIEPQLASGLVAREGPFRLQWIGTEREIVGDERALDLPRRAGGRQPHDKTVGHDERRGASDHASGLTSTGP